MNVYCPLLASAIGGEISGLIETSGLVAKTVLVILLAFSLVSWAIIFSKWEMFRRARAQSNRFIRMFRKSERLQDVAAVAEQFKPSPLIAVFDGAYSELRKQAPQPIRVPSLQRAIQIASSEELTRLESRLPWLATTGAVTPGVSEALITTAAGLFAAIPAVIAYNMFTQHIREFGSRMDDFGLELVNEVERAQSKVARGVPENVERR